MEANQLNSVYQIMATKRIKALTNDQPKGYECLRKINKALYGLNVPLTCLARSKSTSEWPHLDLSIFKILHNQILHRDWLSVHLVTLVTILID